MIDDTASTQPNRPDDRNQGSALLAAPGAVMRHVQRTCHDVERALSQQASVRALTAVPRTLRFMGATASRGRGETGGLPVPNPSPALAAQVVMDELILALAQGLNSLPLGPEYQRVAAELSHARLVYEMRGWLDDPASYHRPPPTLTEPSFDRGRALRQPYQRLLFPSGYEPRPVEPGAQRWAAYEANRTASATILRHPGEPRPWIVAIHGFAMGYPSMDMIGVHAIHLHRDLGLNVAMPVLPLHGPRRINRMSGEAFLSFDLMNSVHGLTQAVWDIRRLMSWIRSQGAPGSPSTASPSAAT